MKKFLWIVVAAITLHTTIVRAERAIALEDFVGAWRITEFSDGKQTYYVTDVDLETGIPDLDSFVSWYKPYSVNMSLYGRDVSMTLRVHTGAGSHRKLQENLLVHTGPGGDEERIDWIQYPSTRLFGNRDPESQAALRRFKQHENLLIDILLPEIEVDLSDGVLSLTTENGYVRLTQDTR